jgi:hypothetical protein
LILRQYQHSFRANQEKDFSMKRKEFLQYTLSLILAGWGSQFLFSGCGGKEEEQVNAEKTSTQDPCGDLSGLTAEEIEVRENFEYVHQTPYPEKRCDNCSLWIAPEEGEPCGGCQIMKGPIKPEGYCTAWIAAEQS